MNAGEQLCIWMCLILVTGCVLLALIDKIGPQKKHGEEDD